MHVLPSRSPNLAQDRGTSVPNQLPGRLLIPLPRSAGHGCPTTSSTPLSDHGGVSILRMDPLRRLHSHVAALTSYETLCRLWQVAAPCRTQKISPPTYRQIFKNLDGNSHAANPNTAARLPNRGPQSIKAADMLPPHPLLARRSYEKAQR